MILLIQFKYIQVHAKFVKINILLNIFKELRLGKSLVWYIINRILLKIFGIKYFEKRLVKNFWLAFPFPNTLFPYPISKHPLNVLNNMVVT